MIEYGDFDDRSVDIRPGDISFLDFGRTAASAEPDFRRHSYIVPRESLTAADFHL